MEHVWEGSYWVQCAKVMSRELHTCILRVTVLIKPPPEDLAPFIERPRSYADDPTIPYHFLVVGTQECEKSIEKSVLLPSKDRWEKFLQAYLDERYAFVCSETMAAIHVAVFVLKELKDFVKGTSRMFLLVCSGIA